MTRLYDHLFHKLASGVLILAEFASLFSPGEGSISLAQNKAAGNVAAAGSTATPASIWQVRLMEIDQADLHNPTGLGFSIRANAFHVLEARDPGQPTPANVDFVKLTPLAHRAGSARIAIALQNTNNVTFDNQAHRLLTLDSSANQLLEIRENADGNLDPATLTRYDPGPLGLQNPQGMSIEPQSGDLFVLDAMGPRLVRIKPGTDGGFANATVSTISLQSSGLTDIRGLAFDPSTGHLHLVSLAVPTLHELTQAGELVAQRDLSPFNLSNPQGMVFAPTSDQTDDPARMSLFLADEGNTTTRSAGQLVELSLDAPTAAATASFSSSLVSTTDMSAVSDSVTGFDVGIAAGSDDAEEDTNNSMNMASTDLDMMLDTGVGITNLAAGMRFNGIPVPQGASIVNAYLQFQTDEVNSEATRLTIQGQAADHATTFAFGSGKISLRPRTSAVVTWSPDPWLTVGQAGSAQRSPNLAAVVQEIVNRPGWASGNSLAFIITGSGQRVAKSYEATPVGNAAPMLHVEWSTASSSTAPTVTINAPKSPATSNQGDSVTFSGSASDPQDGNLSSSLVWTSNRDGLIGGGATFNGSNLSVGVHAITATVTDSGGLQGVASLTITVFAPTNVLLAAGDITRCTATSDEATANLLNGLAGTILTLGDNAYPDGTTADFANCYDPTWGRHKARTRPVPGNHEYHVAGAADYFGYFGPLAGDPVKGYYSFDVSGWHIIALNSEISVSAGSSQEQWLRADLAAHPAVCTLAYWHRPRFSSGVLHGGSTAFVPFWQALYQYGADIVLNGHEHLYERFAKQNPSGVADPMGIREFVVGTGGGELYAIGTPIANSEVANTITFGLLKLTLHPTSYDWEFVPIAGQSFNDSGSASCVGSAPVASPTPTSTVTPTPTVTPIRTATATPTQTPTPTFALTPVASNTPVPDLIFADGFEAGSLSAWSSATTDGGNLSVGTTAALVGTRGMQAVINDNNSIYVTDDRPAAEPRYRVRFYFDPNTIAMAEGDRHLIFTGRTAAETTVLQVEFRRSNSVYQLRALISDDGTTFTSTGWFTISDTPHPIELDWRAATAAGANNGGLTLWIDGAQQGSVTGIDNDTRRIERVRLGAVSGIDSGTLGTYYIDAFESRRQTYIGP